MPPKQDENPILLSPGRSEEHMHHHGGLNSRRILTGSNSRAKELVAVVVDENHNEGKNWGGYCFGDVAAHFEASSKRAHRLTCLLQEKQAVPPNGSHCSPTIAACKSSVENKLPTVLQQTSQLVENWKKSRRDDNNDHMVAKIRTTLGLQSMDQFLDKIELTMSSLPEKEALEKRLAGIMESLRKQGESYTQGKSTPDFTSCSVSPLHGSSSLFFDIAVGPAVQASCGNDKASLRLQAEVQPIVELPAQDLIQDRIAPESVQACLVELESCRHRVEPYHQSSGWIGEAILRVRLSLIGKNHQVPKSFSGEWKDALSKTQIEESAVRIKEVRV